MLELVGQQMVGQQVGDYDLLTWLGEGGHVHAYLARQRSTQRNVVIKVLKSTHSNTPEFVERFKREAEAALTLIHPHIVRVYEYGQYQDILFLAEEFKAGGSLWDILRSNPGKPLPLDQVMRTAEHIAAALDYAHERGIIHHDLKPENVLYDADGNAALTDLGITKALNQEAARTRAGLEFGNPGYMAPEEWQGKPSDGRADVYALGCILFEMLTGQLPFTAHSAGSVMYVHLSHLLEHPLSLRELRPDLPAALETALAKAIEKDVEKRYSRAGELVTAMNAALEMPKASGPQPKIPESVPYVPATSYHSPGSTLEHAPTSRGAGRAALALLVIVIGIGVGIALARWLDEQQDAPKHPLARWLKQLVD